MALLAIDTSTRQLGVALLEGDRLIAAYEVLADYPHAVELPQGVSRVLDAGHTTLDALEAVVVDIGPGSFTGLRIGLAFVKALVFSRKLVTIGVPSLDVLAAGLPFSSRLICPLMDAKQKNVYAALYRLSADTPQRDSEYLLGPLDEVVSHIKEPTLFVGDGCALYRDRLVERLGAKAQFAPSELWWPGAATLARLGRLRLARGERDDPQRLVPLYLYPLDCSVRGPDRPTSVLPKPVAAA